VVGWIKRGPRGIIGTNKPDSQETVRMLLEDLEGGRLDKPEVPSRAVLERLLAERRHDFVSYDDWQLIDLLEQERGRVAGERPRVKFSRVEEMLHHLAERKRDGEGTPRP
jgi:ferredoxin--NADP+ reductase